MADLIDPGIDPVPPAAPDPTAPAPAPPMPVDPRAVRVRLTAASRQGEEPALVVAPAPMPPGEGDTPVARRPLGGAAAAVDATPPDPDRPVRTQRQPLVDGEPRAVGLVAFGDGHAVLDEDGASTRLILEPPRAMDGGVTVREVLVDGFRFEVELEPERIAALRERASRGRAASAHSGPLPVRAIIPGKVVVVSVAAGDAVIAGQQLLVVEAMKMQNELRAPRDGTIERVGVGVGDNIEVGDLLVVIT